MLIGKRLKKVMELPSESWKESSDSWFCHQDEHTLSTGDALMMPKAGQCLVSNTELVVAFKDFQLADIVSDRTEVLCQSCRHMLGVMSSINGKLLMFKTVLETV